MYFNQSFWKSFKEPTVYNLISCLLERDQGCFEILPSDKEQAHSVWGAM